ncbi:MAG TPA: methyltransferase domain-containing protein [Longimicrobiales bacterium]|nr:methyltransferase domain-containing protein [Longimicrobiales bacterium]
MSCSQCLGIERQFDVAVARRQLKRYRRKGPSKMTRRLLDALVSEGASGASFLDVGGGVGAVQHGLIEAGAAVGTSVDAATAYLTAAREEAEARGYADRMRFLTGDIVEVQDDVEPADLVALDRVVCCYHDMPALVDASASKARRAYGLVYPRDTRLVKLAIGLLNLVQRLRRHPFRAFVHATADVEARVESHGLRRVFLEHSVLWQTAVFRRQAEPVADGA